MSSGHTARRELGKKVGEWCETNNFSPDQLKNALQIHAGIRLDKAKIEYLLKGKIAPTEREADALLKVVRHLDSDFQA